MFSKFEQISIIFASIGAFISILLGGMDNLMIALFLFIIIDYITGVICAIVEKKLSSEVGFKGIAKKVFILLLVMIAVMLDKLIGQPVARNLVILFYIANEGLSIVENLGRLGVPYPQKIKEILEQLKEEKTSKNTEK